MNILIVDDEPLIHISIEKLLQTCSESDVIFHAYNGHQMLDLLAAHAFALAYVDIKMPGPSGLEALKLAREISPFTSYYIMTGFDEFEYAKQAIRLKVDDYLMKPLDLATIRETLSAARLHLEAKQEHRKNLFRNWLESTLNRRESSFYECTGYYCGLLLVNVDSASISPECIQEPFFKYDDHIVSIFTEDGLLLLCFSEKFEEIQEIFHHLSAVSYPQGITCFASSITKEPADLRNALDILTRHCCLRVILGVEHFYHLKPLQHATPVQLEFCRSCTGLKHAYEAKDYTAFSNQADLVCRLYQKHGELQKYNRQFLAFLSQILPQQESWPADADSLKEALQQVAKELLTVPSTDSRVQPIIRFIQEHYRENLSTAELSERFGLSANYISNLLKNTLGIRYNDYVTQLRLNHAKELLVSTHMSVKDITTECGYFSQSHFTRLFLEHTGCTPSEYRKNSAGTPVT